MQKTLVDVWMQAEIKDLFVGRSTGAVVGPFCRTSGLIWQGLP